MGVSNAELLESTISANINTKYPYAPPTETELDNEINILINW